jgi:hypothetical protein
MVSLGTCETVGTSKEDVERTPLPAIGSEVPSAVRTNIGGSREDTKDKCVERGVI